MITRPTLVAGCGDRRAYGAVYDPLQRPFELEPVASSRSHAWQRSRAARSHQYGEIPCSPYSPHFLEPLALELFDGVEHGEAIVGAVGVSEDA